jgi:hypothetical protein
MEMASGCSAVAMLSKSIGACGSPEADNMSDASPKTDVLPAPMELEITMTFYVHLGILPASRLCGQTMEARDGRKPVGCAGEACDSLNRVLRGCTGRASMKAALTLT